MLFLPKLVLTFLIILSLNCNKLLATIDVNIHQLKYIADHLSVYDCKYLVASLHYKSSTFPRNAINQVKKLDSDNTCFELLQNWNQGDGKTATHTILSKRLRQMGYDDLSLWLSSSVFKELSEKIENAVIDKEITDDDIIHVDNSTSFPVDIFKENESNDEFEEDEITLAELVGSIATMVLICYGWVKLYRKFCSKSANNK